MPIININAAPTEDYGAITETLKNVRDAGANALKTTRDNVWVTFNPLKYYLNESNSGVGEMAAPPPYVIIKAQAGRTQTERTAFVTAVVSEISKGFLVPSKSIWVQYQEMDPADVWTNDRWVKEI